MVGTYGLNRASENRGTAEVKQGTNVETYPCWQLSVKTDLYNCFKNSLYFFEKTKIKCSISLTNCEIDELVVEFTSVPTEIHSYAYNLFLKLYSPAFLYCFVLYCVLYCIGIVLHF